MPCGLAIKIASQLSVYASIGVITPDMSEHLWLSCTNVGKQPIMCTGFAFKPNRFIKKEKRIIPAPRIEMKELSPDVLPKMLQYSERTNKHFNDDFFRDSNLKKFLSRYKLLARIQLKFLWKVVVTTNIKEFHGKLSNCVIEKILSFQFPVNTGNATLNSSNH